LLLVLAAIYFIGCSTLLHEEFRLLASHIASAALFISNFKFLSESGYFNHIAEVKPLLHLWSLAVEEQFYVVWPFLLWISCKLKLRPSIVTWIVGALSFAANIAAVHQGHPEFAFFLLSTRFWELMLGAALVTSPISLRARVFPWSAAIGLAAICSSTVLIARSSAFALLPTLGTTLLIGASPYAEPRGPVASRAGVDDRPTFQFDPTFCKYLRPKFFTSHIVSWKGQSTNGSAGSTCRCWRPLRHSCPKFIFWIQLARSAMTDCATWVATEASISGR
jgi:peptidoglycan/LPS O-acetylase OafA/YrhL